MLNCSSEPYVKQNQNIVNKQEKSPIGYPKKHTIYDVEKPRPADIINYSAYNTSPNEYVNAFVKTVADK
jgi:hypothetical protein